jgi:hypothetical protein
MTLARQRLNKHCLKAGIIEGAEVNLLDNSLQNICFRGNEGIPVITKKRREEN